MERPFATEQLKVARTGIFELLDQAAGTSRAFDSQVAIAPGALVIVSVPSITDAGSISPRSRRKAVAPSTLSISECLASHVRDHGQRNAISVGIHNVQISTTESHNSMADNTHVSFVTSPAFVVGKSIHVFVRFLAEMMPRSTSHRLIDPKIYSHAIFIAMMYSWKLGPRLRR